MNQFIQNNISMFHEYPFVYSFLFSITIISIILVFAFCIIITFEFFLTIFGKPKALTDSLLAHNEMTNDGAAAICAIACVVCI